jgi:adenylate cyclase class 2
MVEIEVKIRVGDLAPVREKLVAAGLVLARERHREVNTLYDDRNRTLTRGRQALRLRVTGKTATLTFKGVPQKSRRFKIREELETGVRRPQQAAKILKALGWIPVFRYEKRRTIYRKGTLSACLDELAIGNFLELEGEREKIVRLARKLGFPRSAWITKDYVRMLGEAGVGEIPPYSSSFPPPDSSPGSSSP